MSSIVPSASPSDGRHRGCEVDHDVRTIASYPHGGMKIYTKTGDAGETGLFGGERVKKDDPRVQAYGTVDELNAALGIAAAAAETEQRELLHELQTSLFVVGAELAASRDKKQSLRLRLIGKDDIERLERMIDENESALPALENFILPGGSPTAAQLHMARAICRRAERQTVTACGVAELRTELGVFLNRLGDLLFVLARVANQRAGVHDIPWKTRN